MVLNEIKVTQLFLPSPPPNTHTHTHLVHAADTLARVFTSVSALELLDLYQANVYSPSIPQCYIKLKYVIRYLKSDPSNKF